MWGTLMSLTLKDDTRGREMGAMRMVGVGRRARGDAAHDLSRATGSRRKKGENNALSAGSEVQKIVQDCAAGRLIIMSILGEAIVQW